MDLRDWLQIFLFIVLFIGLIPLLGNYMLHVFQGKRTFIHPCLGWLERLTYRVTGTDPTYQMSWWEYGKALILFNFLGFALLFLLQLLQHYLPLNPQHFPGVDPALAFNTAISFVTNTNWQAYSGETTLSYSTQMFGLTVQNFLSAATGFTAMLPLVRGFTTKNTLTIGNFWVDLVRSIVFILLPLSIILALVLVSQGVIQNFSSYVAVETLEHGKQTIPMGPVASQVAIKQLGTNGGGFFNANSAHPFENPTGLSNFLETLAILAIPGALLYTFGKMIGSRLHGWIIFGVMFVFWIGGLAIALHSQVAHNSLEGIETRFGTGGSILWSISTTATANGSVNAMLDSLSPLAGGVAMFNLMLGELIFGGIGVGFCSMLHFILLTVFLSGLMVGRTPEYLGKKIGRREIQWVMVAILVPCCLILLGAGVSCVLPAALSSLGNQGPHGLTEILYAFASTAANNGSAFAGLNANTDYYNSVLGCVMFCTRLAIIIPSLAVGGLLAQKKRTPRSAGTFSENSLLFAILLIGVILIVGALTFFPALALAPFIEHLLMLKGQSF